MDVLATCASSSTSRLVPPPPPAPPAKRKGSEACSTPRGHYDVLGLLRTANAGEIRRGYRQQALRTHPDKGGNSKDFQRVMLAYDVLSVPEARMKYDEELVRTSNEDGLGAAAAPRAPEVAPESDLPEKQVDRQVRTDARILTVQLLNQEPDKWEEEFKKVSRDILEEVLAWVFRDQSRKIKKETILPDPTDYPREEPAQGLPAGWMKVQKMYQTGISAGQVYSRFRAPWGQMYLSMTASLKAEAEHSGWQLDQATLERLSKRRRVDQVPQVPQAPVQQQARQSQQVLQRNIYSVKAYGANRYYVSVNWSYFRVSTQKTDSLPQAIDWHIALSDVKAAAKARPNSLQDPLTDEEFINLLRQEPDLQLKFSSNFNKGEYHNIYTPSCGNLSAARETHQRFHALIWGSGTDCNPQGFKTEREACSKFIEQQKAELEVKQNELNAAVVRFFQAAYGALPRRPTLLGLARPDLSADQAGQEASSPHVPLDAFSKPLTPEEEHEGQVALDLQNAMGLTQKNCIALVETLKRLAQPELQRRLAIIAAPEPLVLLPEPPPPPPQDKSRKTTSTRSWLQRTSSCPDKEKDSQPFSGPKALADQQPKATMLALAAPSPAVLTPASWIPGLPDELVVLEWLRFHELYHLQLTSQAALQAGRREEKRQLQEFAYVLGCLQFKPVKTRVGRQTSNTDGSVEVRSLAKFLHRPLHVDAFERLDLSKVPNLALESAAVQSAFRTMPRLERLVLPSEGWTTPNHRNQFMCRLPKGLNVICVDPRGVVKLQGIVGEQ